MFSHEKKKKLEKKQLKIQLNVNYRIEVFI